MGIATGLTVKTTRTAGAFDTAPGPWPQGT